MSEGELPHLTPFYQFMQLVYTMRHLLPKTAVYNYEYFEVFKGS